MRMASRRLPAFLRPVVSLDDDDDEEEEDDDDDGNGAAAAAATAKSPAALKAAHDAAMAQYVDLLRPRQFRMVPIPLATHCFKGAASLPAQPLPQRAKRIRREIAALATELPLAYGSSVFVRADDSRPDVLRALIIGPEGTPYQDGCFVFDIYLPADYPARPPMVRWAIFSTSYGLTYHNLYLLGPTDNDWLWPGALQPQLVRVRQGVSLAAGDLGWSKLGPGSLDDAAGPVVDQVANHGGRSVLQRTGLGAQCFFFFNQTTLLIFKNTNQGF
jgi:hypothetical protein